MNIYISFCFSNFSFKISVSLVYHLSWGLPQHEFSHIHKPSLSFIFEGVLSFSLRPLGNFLAVKMKVRCGDLQLLSFSPILSVFILRFSFGWCFFFGWGFYSPNRKLTFFFVFVYFPLNLPQGKLKADYWITS